MWEGLEPLGVELESWCGRGLGHWGRSLGELASWCGRGFSCWGGALGGASALV